MNLFKRSKDKQDNEQRGITLPLPVDDNDELYREPEREEWVLKYNGQLVKSLAGPGGKPLTTQKLRGTMLTTESGALALQAALSVSNIRVDAVRVRVNLLKLREILDKLGLPREW